MMGKRTGVAFAGEIEMILLPAIETQGLNADEHLLDVLLETRRAIATELAKVSE